MLTIYLVVRNRGAQAAGFSAQPISTRRPEKCNAFLRENSKSKGQRLKHPSPSQISQNAGCPKISAQPRQRKNFPGAKKFRE